MARITAEESSKVQQQVLRAAADELARCGYQGLRIPEVARVIGKTQGAVYGRFPDKEALALAAVRFVRNEIIAPRLAEALEAEGGSAFDKLEALSAVIAEVASSDRNGERMITRLAMELGNDPGPVGKEVREFFGMFVEVIKGLLKQARADGELRDDIDIAAVAYATTGMQIGLSTMAAMCGKKTNYRALEAAMRPILTRGISTGRKRRRKR